MECKHSLHIATIALLFAGQLILSCSRKNSDDSSEPSDIQSSEASAFIETNSDSRPNDNGEGVPGYNQAFAPQPITGTNLVEVLISSNCVNLGSSACSQVRLSAKVKVNSSEPVRFAADTVSGLGIKSSSWDIAPLAGVTCQTTGGGLDFNPLCTATSGSLAQAKIKATLNLVATDGSAFKGDSPDSVPGTGKVYGNFMLLDASAGLTPQPASYPGASSPFTQIWQDLVSGRYFTNNLYEGQGSTYWFKSVTLCGSISSGDGAGKWHLPTGQELCGSAFNDNASSNTCSDGLYGHGLTTVPVVLGGRSWDDIMYVWSSSPASSANAWYVDLSDGSTYGGVKSLANAGVFCVHE